MSEFKEEQFREIPKIELHLHLEGAGRESTIMELSSRPGAESTSITASSVCSIDKYQGLSHFILTIRSLMDSCLRNAKDYERIALELFEDLAKQNVVYAEVSFDPLRGLRVGIPYDDMLAAVYGAKKAAEEKFNIKIGLIIGLGREIGPQTVKEFASKAAHSKKYGVIGLDLHGNESAYSPKEFVEAFEIANASGLGLRAHAGEGMGPQSIWDAINYTKVTRIGHGIRALEDPVLLQYLKEHKIVLDMCPTSNYKLGIVASMTEHPIRSYFDQGIKVNISTDDPFFFNTSITREYYNLAQYLGFTMDELNKITLDAAEAAFLEDSEKSKLKTRIKEWRLKGLPV